MKPRVRPISNLYFRWGRDLGLESEEVAVALQAADLITRIGPTMYSETPKPKVPLETYNKIILDILNLYKERKQKGKI